MMSQNAGGALRFFSRFGQDRFLFEHFFHGKRGGVFVDVGAYDGETFSNTLFFEKSLGWSGLCIEPGPRAFHSLSTKRSALCRQVCVADFDGEDTFTEVDCIDEGTMLSGLARYFDPRHVQRLQRSMTSAAAHKLPVTRLSSLLHREDLTQIDYCSIDTEGAELAVLSGIDFEKTAISVLTIENNYGDERIATVMAAKGYDVVARLEQDIVFKRRDFKALPRTSVICAVWHGDPDRLDLLRGHAENLARQTVPVEPIYVFDGGDPVPSWLEAKAVSVRQPLTIYQAWNVALSLVETPLVMNLNLDDRLAPDAVALMQDALRREQASAVGGDWRICHSRGDTDDTQPCYPADQLPVAKGWPPKPGTTAQCLGSGTGRRSIYGPAVLWTMEAHVGAPRYPWRFADGTPIRTAGDLAWWRFLYGQGRKIVRLPTIIGHYQSHPDSQAEFRKLPHDEWALLQELGMSLL